MWAAATFGTLAVVVDAERLLPEEPSGVLEELALRAVIALLVLFPYLLYRFSATFEPASSRLEAAIGALTGGMVVWAFALSEVPTGDEPRSLGFELFVAGLVLHWTVLTVVVAGRLWRAGRAQPSVARTRMRLLAAAAALLTGALLLSAFLPGDDDSAAELAGGLLTTLSAVAFLVALTPPALVRAAWRGPEAARLDGAIAGLITASSEAEVADRVLPVMAEIVGARAVVLQDDDGRVVGSHGAGAEALPTAGPGVFDVPLPHGGLRVWASPYAPFFGDEELRLLRSLGALTGLALEHARLFAQERAAREALQRADELKSQFVALAAHELRSPFATIRGLAEVIELRGDQLPAEQRAHLESTLFAQIRRITALVDQLLDLSRLDAEAIAVEPRVVDARPLLEEAVHAVAGDGASEVFLDVDARLRVQVDPAVVERVVSNLVANAFRHGRPPVRVRAVQNDRHFRVVVEDEGEGVPPEFVPKLFERFTRAAAAGRRGPGSGLGLAIARSYARAHGGELLYEPAAPKGARFELVVPARRPL